MDKNIVSTPLSKISPYNNNAKIHSKDQIDLIVKSIEDFGYINYIVVDEDYIILAGHGRYEALKQLGRKKIGVLQVTGLTPEQKRKYRLIDNRMSELSERDIDLVKAELIDLGDVDFSDVFSGLVDISVDTFDSLSPMSASSGFDDISKGVDPVDLSHSTGQTEARANTEIKGSDVKIETTSRKGPIKYELYFDDEGQKSEFMGYLEQIGAIYGSWSMGGNLTERLANHL